MTDLPVATVADAEAVLEVGLKACHAYARPDLAERLEAARRRLADPEIRVLVVGEFKQGKSTLVNSLLGAAICPVDDDVATCVPTVVRRGDPPRAVAYFRGDGDATPEPEPFDPDRIADFASEAGNVGNELGVERVEVELPGDLLASGLTLVDTPGVGGLGSKHGAMTLGVLPSADAVLLVSDASQEYTEPELAFLTKARDLCPNIVCVLTKIDLYPEWRRIADLDRGHLERAGFEVEVFAVSAPMRDLAIETDDQELYQESGYPDLLRFVHGGIVARGQRLAVRGAAGDVLGAVAQIEASFASERAILADPEGAGGVVDRLEDANTRAQRLIGEASRWQVTLGDGMADLNADVDHDFKLRMRSLVQEAEGAIAQSDPADMWDEFQLWLEQAVASEVIDNFSLLTRRTEELAEAVADHFAEVEADVNLGLDVSVPLDALDIARAGEIHVAKQGLGSGVMTAMRGSYGGVLMFGMISRMVGFGMLNPVAGLAGLLLGRKAVKEERERRLTQRRQETRAAARQYVDEVGFHVGKEMRDACRRAHRQLRDAFTRRAEELQRSCAAALEAVKQSSESGPDDRRRRLEAIQNELHRLEHLRERALALAPDLRRPERA